MSGQATLDSKSSLRALLADPGAAAGFHLLRVRSRSIRLGVAAIDAAQLIFFALALRMLFPEVAAMLTAGQAAALASLAAVLALPVRYSLRISFASDPESSSSAAFRAVAANAVALMEIGALVYLALPADDMSSSSFRWWIAVWFLASATCGAALRFAAAWAAAALTGGRRVVVVGALDEAEPLMRCFKDEQSGQWCLAGCLEDREPGHLEKLLQLVSSNEVDVVALAMSGPDAAARARTVGEWIADQPVRMCQALDTQTSARLPPVLNHVGRFALVDLLSDPQGDLDGAMKRAMDLVISTILCVVLAPLFAVVALAIRLESPGPALFRQWRFGLGNRPILVFKFRTMRTSLCDTSGERRTIACDPRVTPLGRLLRRTSLDELPQIINVLRGEMSLVGPRPHPLHMRVDEAYYFEAVDAYRLRHVVKPGITGWAQVNGSRGMVDTLEKARRRVELDLWYIQHWSIVLDLRILLRTFMGGFLSPHAD